MTSHPLGAPWVRDQLSYRTQPLNEKRTQPEGEFVLYWMQSTQRLDDNWALRYATLEADRLGRPLLVLQQLDASYPHASARHHTFLLQGTRDIAHRAHALGLEYQLTFSRSRFLAPPVERLAARAALVVTDLFPTWGVAERSGAFAERAWCRVVAIDGTSIVPSGTFTREEYAARTIRPKLLKLLDLSLERVEDRAPRKPLPAGIRAIAGSDEVDAGSLTDARIAQLVSESRVDHSVGAVATHGGSRAADARLAAFVDGALADYSERRRHPSDEWGSSRLSAYLHHGHIGAADVARTVLERAPRAAADAYLNEMVVWRELSLNFCLRSPDPRSLLALPDWVQRSMARHAGDARDFTYGLDALERGETHDDLWNAGQCELVTTGAMHNVVRMLWGKSVLTWAPTYAQALEWLVHLNDRYALDGSDPNSYAGIQWCFGKFDRPFAERAVWGTIRPMSLVRARVKYDVAAYLERFGMRKGELALR
ncbi:MAG: phr [Gemmatimonadetes bacterium]|nr:phr [Gemmatimonadota bacterium]